MGSPDIHSFHISGVGSAAMRNFTAIICLLVAAQASAMIWNRPIYGPGGIQPIYGPDGKQPIIYGPGGIRPIYGPDGINPNPIIGGPDGVNPNPIIGGPDGVRPTPDNLYYPVCPAGSIVKIPISELEPSLVIHFRERMFQSLEVQMELTPTQLLVVQMESTPTQLLVVQTELTLPHNRRR